MEGRAAESDRAKALVKASSLDERGAVVRLTEPEETERESKRRAKLRGGGKRTVMSTASIRGQKAQGQCAGPLCIEDET